MTDQKMIGFSIPGKVKGQPRPRITTVGGHPRAYDPQDAVDYKSWVRMRCIDAMRVSHNTDPCPIAGTGYQLEIVAHVSVPSSWSKKRAAAALRGEVEPRVKPDADNIAKIIMDAINGILWRDDKDVTSLMVSKVYSEKETVCVTVCWKEEKDV